MTASTMARVAPAMDPREGAIHAEGLEGGIEGKVDSISDKRTQAAETEEELHKEDMDAHAKALQRAMQTDEYFVDSVKFHTVIGVFILANMVTIGLEQDYGYRFTDEEMTTLTAMEPLQ